MSLHVKIVDENTNEIVSDITGAEGIFGVIAVKDGVHVVRHAKCNVMALGEMLVRLQDMIRDIEEGHPELVKIALLLDALRSAKGQE